MARRKQANGDAIASPASTRSGLRKRALEDQPDSPTESIERSSAKRRRTSGKNADLRQNGHELEGEAEVNAAGHSPVEDDAPTPTPRKRGRPKKVIEETQEDGRNATPSGRRSKKALETLVKVNGTQGTPGRRNLADRSARRKSARALISRVVTGHTSDDDDGDENLQKEIYESSESEDGDEVEERGDVGSDDETEEPAGTPSKSRGRPKSTTRKTVTRKKSPSPPRDLPPHELYFFQNKPGLTKTSNNNLASLNLLTHEEYFNLLRDHKDPHSEDIQFLQRLHAESFQQWAFELSQGFSICLFGYGSKRPLLHQFAKHLFVQTQDHQQKKIVIVNGYVRTITIRDILTTLANAVDPSSKLASANPVAMVQSLSAMLRSTGMILTIILNSIDAGPLRKGGVQSILSQLASHPQIRLVCSTDTPDFSLLWDSAARSSFNFVFHDCTTFAPFTAELDVVDDVHELLGRNARRVGGKDGVTFVLRSLPENAKSLFRLLVGEVLVAMEDESGVAPENPGVEYRMLYNKAVEEFVCSSEMAFRTLLKEFHDHQMITSRKDVLGTELLSVPFRKEELEAILEDLTS